MTSLRSGTAGTTAPWLLIGLPTALISLLLVAIGVLLPAGAQASVQIFSFNAQPSSSQAGAHPDLGFSFVLSNHDLRGQELGPCSCNDAKDVTVHTPPGLIGNPHATPQCSVAEFSSDLCPVDSQVGVVAASLADGPGGQGALGRAGFVAPVFNIVPPPGEAGLLGFKSGLGVDSPNFEVLSARTNSDYGLDAATVNIEHWAPLWEFKQVLWGVPADPIHDDLRFAPGQATVQPLGVSSAASQLCDANLDESTEDPASAFQLCPGTVFKGGPAGGVNFQAGELVGHPVASNSPLTPFTQNPTTCGLTSLESSIDVLAYDKGETHASSTWPATTDCDQLAFNPSLFAQPTTAQTDSPSGLDADLKAPSFESPETPSPSEIKGTTVTLPPGFTINPSAADGKVACTEAEAKFGTTEEARCPEDAKIGTLEVHSPVLPGVLPGAIYIGEPQPGNRYRLIIAFDGFGVHVKLPGSARPDPVTGRVITEFKNLPQFPFEDFDLHFFGSERGILATPTQCGTYPVTTEFEPWDAALPDQTSTQFFTLGSGPGGSACPNGPRPFAPGFAAGVTNSVAGAHSPFSLDLTRKDGEQNLTALDVTTPPGFAATLAGVPYCPESAIAAAQAPGYSGLAEQAHPSCPAASQVGEAIAGAGAGTHPFYAPGKVYLAGPYKGAPLSLVVITPAVSGPYDLGDVVLRTALQIDPYTAQVTAISDPLPQILEGVPLRLRSILVNLDRPNFALNPTNCEPFTTTAKVFGSEGATAGLSSPFQVANCAKLGFAPKLALSLKGGTRRDTFPALKAVLTYPQGAYANIKKAQVTLPHSAFLEQGHIKTVCTRPELASHTCPAASIYGHATAVTPLLEKPLEGPVYLGAGFGHKLPDLVAELDGQIDVLLDGKVDSGKEDGLRNTFLTVPDAPVSKFTLELFGGRRGLIVNSENLCSPTAKTKAIADFTGQNGKTYDTNPTVSNSCKSKGKKKHKALRANKNGGPGR